jgi:hypothetical protein
MTLDQLKKDIIKNVTCLAMDKSSYEKIIVVFADAEFRLAKEDRKKLKSFVDIAANENVPDLIAFRTFLNSIDFDKARACYQGRKPGLKSLKGTFSEYKPPKRVKVTATEILSINKGTVKIGLGLESNVKLSRVKADDVVIDKNTDKKNKNDRSILYATGWNIEGAFTKE